MWVAQQHRMAGRDQDAASICVQILQAAPEYHDALHLLSVLMHRHGRQQDALTLIDRALVARRTAPALAHRANVLISSGRHVDAVAALRSALELAPDDADARRELANELIILEQPVEAEVLLRQVLAVQPEHPEATALLGTALLNQARYAEAEPLLSRIATAYPNDPYMRLNLGITLFYQGRHGESHQLLRSALEKFPAVLTAHSPLLYTLSCDGGFGVDEYLRAVRRFGAAVRARAHCHTQWRHAAGDPSVTTLRVGLVSGDLGQHPVGYFLESFLGAVDRARISFHAYATWPRQDALGARLRAQVAGWRDIHGMTDEAAAKLISEDGIDILIDLSGHTMRNRLPLFAWKPAPVQVTWLGFFASTGVAEIDWILTDPIAAPASEAGQFSEQNWPLPETRLCFAPPVDAPAVAPLPALRSGHITFGSFQNMAKLTDAVLALWARTLTAVPGARLRLQNGELAHESARAALWVRLASAGLGKDRVELHGPGHRDAYLASYAAVDIVLDSFPFHGGTTTCEALWMGVPTLALRGNTLLSRQGESLLVNAGLPDWLADDADDFVRRAVDHAAQPSALAELRAQLRERVRESPLFDGKRFAHHFSEAMHGLWCASAPTGLL